MVNKEKVKITTELLTFFLKCHRGVEVTNIERNKQINFLKKWKNDEGNYEILKEVKFYLKMVEKVQLNKGKLDYEIRKLIGLNKYFTRIEKGE